MWKRDCLLTTLALRPALDYCLAKELQITSDHVCEFRVFALALECTHLNTGFIGYCRLDLTSDSQLLVDGVKHSFDFGLRYRFIDVEEVQRQAERHTLWSEDSSTWHPTARLRIHLTLNALQQQIAE